MKKLARLFALLAVVTVPTAALAAADDCCAEGADCCPNGPCCD